MGHNRDIYFYKIAFLMIKLTKYYNIFYLNYTIINWCNEHSVLQYIVHCCSVLFMLSLLLTGAIIHSNMFGCNCQIRKTGGATLCFQHS